MKREWFYKHQNIVPSVCMLLHEWKVDEDWKNQELSIIGLVEKVRFALQGRFTKIMVFLLVKKDPVDREDLKVEDFLANLRKITQLDLKSIYILDERDLNQSMTSKITKSIIELSNSYYKDLLTRIKKVKSEISKQPILLIRHKIKAAFINEIVGQSSKVQKSLQAAYDQLIEFKDEKTTLHEIRTVADYLNFKICQSKLADKKIDVAIKQFLSHINWYKKGESELMFQHWALIYRQYKTFGELIEKVVDVSQTQQGSYYIPGYYFQCAANAGRMRKKFYQSTCLQHKETTANTFSDTSKFSNDDEHKLKTGYIGQITKGTHQIPYIREITLELNVQHSEDIIRMLTKAYDHYYKRNQKRMIYYIASLIAEEHYFCQRWEKAKKFFERITNYYKKDGWYYPLTNILKYSLECCLHLNLPEQYLNHAIELISDKNSNTLEERKEVLSNILRYLEKPFIAPLLQPIIFPMDSSHSLLTMKCQFEIPFVPVYQETKFRLLFNYRGPEPLFFSKLMIYFNSEKYNIVNDSTGIQLIPNQENIFSFPMLIKDKIDLECITITLQLGNSPNAIIFKWQMMDNKYYFQLLQNYDYRNEIGSGLFFERPVIRVIPPKPNLSLTFQHTPPICIDEYYPLTIIIQSNEDHVISGKISPIMNDRFIKFYDTSYQLINESIRFSEIPPKSNQKIQVFVKSKQLEGTQIFIQFHVEYDSKNYSGLVIDQNLEIRWLFPFNTIFQIEGTSNLKNSDYYLNPLSSKSYIYKIQKDTNELMNIELRDEKRKESDIFSSNDPIILTTKLTNVSPHTTFLKSIEFKSENFKLLSPSKVEISKTLNNLDLFNFIHVILPLKENQTLSLGSLIVEFERGDNGYISAKNEMIIPLPTIQISDNKFQVSLDIPKEGKLGQSMMVTLCIQNNSFMIQDLTLTVSDSDYFLFSGTNSINFQILPFSKRSFQYNIIPLQVGHLGLPKFNVSNKNHLLLSGNEDWTVFIKP